jgi:hypothetical protein
MTERTITKEQLEAALSKTTNISCLAFHAVIAHAFPPIFKPKEGEAIIVSLHADFRNPKIRIFCYINDDDEYVCFIEGNVEKTTTVGFDYAKPQTPTQKGE